VYEFLVDFPSYANYSEYLESVDVLGPAADEQARYALRFAWWKLTYTARSAVTETVANERIEWTLIDDVEARGRWQVVERETLPPEAPAWAETATDIRFVATWNPRTVDAAAVDLPRLVSLDWVFKKVEPIVEQEAERVVERAVTDLEGRERPVDLTVRTDHESR
jgi:uncharacterized membrane protein